MSNDKRITPHDEELQRLKGQVKEFQAKLEEWEGDLCMEQDAEELQGVIEIIEERIATMEKEEER